MAGGLGRSLCLKEGKKGSIRDVGDAGLMLSTRLGERSATP